MPAARVTRPVPTRQPAPPRIPAQRKPPDEAPEESADPGPVFRAASLTQRHARSGRHCDGCGNQRITEIGMTLTDGTVALFSSCHRCERKNWRAAETGRLIDVSFDAVLDRTRKIR